MVIIGLIIGLVVRRKEAPWLELACKLASITYLDAKDKLN